MISITTQPGFSGTVSGRNLYVLSHTTPASVFVELGNIQNTFDQRRLVMNSNRQALAKWLMEGFLKDYKEKKIIFLLSPFVNKNKNQNVLYMQIA